MNYRAVCSFCFQEQSQVAVLVGAGSTAPQLCDQCAIGALALAVSAGRLSLGAVFYRLTTQVPDEALATIESTELRRLFLEARLREANVQVSGGERAVTEGKERMKKIREALEKLAK